MSNNVEIMFRKDTHGIIQELLDSLLDRYQKGIE